MKISHVVNIMPKAKEEVFSQYESYEQQKRIGSDTSGNSKGSILGVCIYYLIVLSILLTINFRYILEE